MGIEIKNLTYTYNENTSFARTALVDINLKIDDGEIIGIIGHTGSGKSTLIQHMNGLIKCKENTILVDGEDIFKDKSKLKFVRQKVGLVFQFPEHQLFEETIYKDIAYGAKNLKLDQEEIDKRVKEAMEIVGLSEDMKEKSPFDLSGGQKRRVAIAGILVMKPKVLILDEPAAGLDPRGREKVLSQIKKLHDTLGITIIIVSHSMEEMIKLVDRILVMHNGKIKYDDKSQNIFAKQEELEKIGLTAPDVIIVLNELKKIDSNVNTNVKTVEEATEEIYKFMKGNYVKN